jgi:hypothetical protein
MKTNKFIFEIIQSFGYDLAVRPIDLIMKTGVLGRVLSLILLFIWCLPVLVIFSLIAFLFWIFKK